MKKLVFLFLALGITMSIRAYDFTVNGIFYNITSSVSPFTVEVTYPSIPTIDEPGYSGDITIPSLVSYDSNTYNVTAIGHDAFSLSVNMSSLIIPPTVTTIGTNAFRYCIGLNTISLPVSLKTIEGYAFESCNGLTTLSIPRNVSTLGEFAFDNCSGLTSVFFPALSSVHSLEMYAFDGCTSLVSISLPDSLTSIGSSAFCACYKLTSITIPASVNTIGNYTFQNCRSLTSINIPASVTTIVNNAFCECTGLTSIYAYSASPVILDLQVFFDVNTTSCVLYVPIGSKAAYQGAAIWNDFANIIDNLPTSINSVDLNKVKVILKANCVVITGLEANEKISMYDLKGNTLYHQQVQTKSVEVKLPAHGVYLVKVNDQKMKVIY